LTVTIDALGQGDSVVLSLTGTGGGHGTATIVGATTLTQTGTIDVRGDTQSDKFKGCNITIRATVNGQHVADSAPFSICAHITKWSASLDREVVTVSAVGILAKMQYEADTDPSNLNTLSEAFYMEHCELPRRDNPPFKAATTFMKEYSKARTTGLAFDRHMYTKRNIAAGNGKMKTTQVWMMKCRRCGALDDDTEKSGFNIEREIYTDAGNRWFTIKKSGAAVTHTGHASSAGSGTAESNPTIV